MNQEFDFPQEHIFSTKAGLQFAGFPQSAIESMHQALSTELFISEIQTCEAASYSMAMVVRFALGLSAHGGSVIALVDDTLAGKVVLGTVRQLRNAGSLCEVICLNNPETASDCFKQLLKPLEVMEVNLHTLGNSFSVDDLNTKAAEAHNVLNGLFGTTSEHLAQITETLNELSTPIHCVSCPTGVDPDTGKSTGTPLFASSTLSLGAPMHGLNTGHEYAGRHYVCDVSIPRELYLRNGFDLSLLFSEQPVVQILPYLGEEEGEG